MSGDQLTFPPAPLWRPTDPRTSREAGLSKIGDREGLRARILIVLGLSAGRDFTDEEIGEELRAKFGLGYQPSIIKRRGELVAGGWVDPVITDVGLGVVQLTRENSRGHQMLLWKISLKGMEFLYELDGPATCGAPMIRGLHTLVCSTHGAGCTERRPSR